MAGWLIAAAAGMQAGGSIYEGSQNAESLRAQAKAKEREALATREQGVATQIQFNEETRRLMGTQRQLYGQAGVTLEGAPEDLMSRTKTARTMDRMQMSENTRYAVDSLLADARQMEKAAESAMIGGWLKGGTEAFSTWARST